MLYMEICAIVKCLDWMNNIETNYGSPGLLFNKIFENDINFKHYWSVNEFLNKGNLGLIQSTIQNN